jgi:hypothetical protein
MNLEHISVENHQRLHQSYLPGLEESTIFLPPSLLSIRIASARTHHPKKWLHYRNIMIIMISMISMIIMIKEVH